MFSEKCVRFPVVISPCDEKGDARADDPGGVSEKHGPGG